NFGYIVTMMAAIGISYLVYMLQMNEIIKGIIITLIVIFSFYIYNGAVHGMTRDIADDKNPGFKDFFRHLKSSLKISMLFAFIFSSIMILSLLSFDIYRQSTIIFRDAARFLILGSIIIIVTASQYFFPIYFGLDKRFPKMIKKMFLLFFDNPLFTFGLLIISAILIFISTFSIFIVPGFASVPLLLNVGLKLRLYKYDYLEDHPDTKSSKIPWDTLLHEDKIKVGKRTLKGMIFPWKE
ncbi:MAG: hypothetical protein JXJ04_11525, partial [Spirochaetales bacterium]|nr:hypothetical protein [Spirochaetales bacterium]